MTLKITAFAAAAALLSMAGAASAASGAYVATFDKAPAIGDSAVLGDIVWRCTGNSCQTTSSTDNLSPSEACRIVTRAAKATVTGFTVKGAPVAADMLTKCNTPK